MAPIRRTKSKHEAPFSQKTCLPGREDHRNDGILPTHRSTAEREEMRMPRYLSLFKYSPEGAKGFLKEKAAAREVASRKAFESVGGKLETFYWATSGEYTGIAIAELPDAASGAALLALVDSSGAFSEFRIIELLTASEVDRALSKSMAYRPPGA
jgi:uncharacterized protein with GYD domain